MRQSMDTWLGRQTPTYGSFLGMWVLSSSSPGVWVAITRISLSLPRICHLLFMTSYPILYDGKTETSKQYIRLEIQILWGEESNWYKTSKGGRVFCPPDLSWSLVCGQRLLGSSRQGGSITPRHLIGFRPNIFSHNCSTYPCSSGRKARL